MELSAEMPSQAVLGLEGKNDYWRLPRFSKSERNDSMFARAETGHL